MPKSRQRGVSVHQRQGKREDWETSEKSEEKEREPGTEGESQAFDALIGHKEQNGKQKRHKERNRERDPTQLP